MLKDVVNQNGSIQKNTAQTGKPRKLLKCTYYSIEKMLMHICLEIYIYIYSHTYITTVSDVPLWPDTNFIFSTDVYLFWR